MAKTREDVVERRALLLWLTFTGVTAFAFVLLWRFGLVRLMVESDKTYLSVVITLLYVGTSLHCLWRILVVSREGDAARRAAGPDASPPPQGLVSEFLGDLARKAAESGPARPDATALLRSLATRLRAPNRFGDFMSDTLMKLGLVGTIIGFIMMLAPIATLDTADRGAIKVSMNLMSDGMAVAMYTTLAGLVASILVKLQYYLLEDATAQLFLRAVDLGDAWLAPPRAGAAPDAAP